jgi:hypothetical protein
MFPRRHRPSRGEGDRAALRSARHLCRPRFPRRRDVHYGDGQLRRPRHRARPRPAQRARALPVLQPPDLPRPAAGGRGWRRLDAGRGDRGASRQLPPAGHGGGDGLPRGGRAARPAAAQRCLQPVHVPAQRQGQGGDLLDLGLVRRQRFRQRRRIPLPHHGGAARPPAARAVGPRRAHQRLALPRCAARVAVPAAGRGAAILRHAPRRDGDRPRGRGPDPLPHGAGRALAGRGPVAAPLPAFTLALPRRRIAGAEPAFSAGNDPPSRASARSP